MYNPYPGRSHSVPRPMGRCCCMKTNNAGEIYVSLHINNRLCRQILPLLKLKSQTFSRWRGSLQGAREPVQSGPVGRQAGKCFNNISALGAPPPALRMWLQDVIPKQLYIHTTSVWVLASKIIGLSRPDTSERTGWLNFDLLSSQ